MGKISVAEIKELMKTTGVGMMDCKRALEETDGDMDKAVVILREKGLATQAKKADRVAAEGIVMAMTSDDHKVGAVVEVNIETDFAAKNPKFVEFVNNVAKTIIEQAPADIDALNACTISGGSMTVAETLSDLFISIRENMQIRRFKRMEGVLVPYVHDGGKIGVMVNMDTAAGAVDAVLAAGKDCALQAAAMNPSYLKREDVPDSALEEEKKIMLAQMADDPKMASKPEQVRVKIVEGKIGKYYSENCLLEQDFVKDNSLTIQKYLDTVAKEVGSPVTVSEFVRFERGEGIEKKEDNLADEVAKMIK